VVSFQKGLPLKSYIHLIYTPYTNVLSLDLIGRIMAQAVSRQPLSDFSPGSVHVRFIVDKVALGQVFLRVLRISPVNIIPLALNAYVSPGGQKQ
jgi:hypothetical protein